ncbi:10604_t:CDS:1 [Acaulospora colombiana]|uniref:10604_t:CDS:1 n=1 Tax=Acaulospora colombiana TaxID=27376 RepID=A0ACA9N575_9GLOM|nr:10604_t:CDS:1 [Acaulospora colombiana]
MQAEETPPTYSEYPTELPEQLPIGQHNVRPLVNVTELQAHLKLLGAFSELKRDVQDQQDGIVTDDRDQVWVVFVNRAVHRFFAWTSAQWELPSPGLYPDMMPPLDVMMVWHTYLLVWHLNLLQSRLHRLLEPICLESSIILRRSKSVIKCIRAKSTKTAVSYQFREALRVLRCQFYRSMPVTLLATLIDSETLKPIPPSESQESLFITTSGMPYEMPLVTTSQETLSLTCPRCLENNSSVHWVTSSGQGFAQPNFSYKCEHCQVDFSKANIGIRRFSEEISRKRAGENVYISYVMIVCPEKSIAKRIPGRASYITTQALSIRRQQANS